MNPKTLAGWRLPTSAALVVCGVLWSPSSADEPAADDQNQVLLGTDLDLSAPVALQSTLFTRLALDTFYVAANSDRIGADVTQVDDVLRSHLGLGEGKGLVVTSVADDSPAAKAGIQKNDVLVTVGGEEVAGSDALRKSLEASADKPIAIGLIRGGKKQSVEVTPKSTTGDAVVFSNNVISEPKYWLGLGLASADDTLRSQLALSAGESLVVTSVENDSPAAKAGVMVNDVLLKLDGKALTTIEALSEQLQTIGDKPVVLELLRRGKPATLTVTAEKHADSRQFLMTLDNHVHFQDLVLFTPQVFTFEAPNVTYTPAKPDLVRQIGELEAQVKQLEASLGALRAAIEPSAQPAQTGVENKEGK